MKALIEHLRYRGPVYLVAAMALFLVAADIARTAGLNWAPVRAFLGSLKAPRDASPIVRNYTEFVRVRHDEFDIVTGMQFSSSVDGQVTSQWCYLEWRTARPGQPEQKLTLASATGTAKPVIRSFTPALLQPFGLSAQTAAGLAGSQCRFRSG